MSKHYCQVQTEGRYRILLLFEAMSLKVAAAETLSRMLAVGENERNVVVVREYNEGRDKMAVEEMEMNCEVGQRGKPSLVTDLLGDPVCRVRHFPSHVMLVAEYGEEGHIVGVIRACIKTVTRESSSLYSKLAYILGLRVSPTHRRLGIATKLVQEIENWCKQNGAEYAYMATDCTNEPSINLFTRKCHYTKFRSLTMLVQPVHAHRKPISSSSGITIVRLTPSLAGKMYRQVYAVNAEFFPEDFDAILSSKFNLGTFMAVPKTCLSKWCPKTGMILRPPSFALLSVWNTKEVFKLQVKGMPRLKQACCVGSRLLDGWMQCLRLPSFPDVFRKFGVYFLYGLHMEGNGAPGLMKALCAFVHNMARDDDGCGAVVAEVGQHDPVREAIPHWRKLSWAEDLWCVKKLKDAKGHGDGTFGPLGWTKSPSSSHLIFVDPRDF